MISSKIYQYHLVFKDTKVLLSFDGVDRKLKRIEFIGITNVFGVGNNINP